MQKRLPVFSTVFLATIFLIGCFGMQPTGVPQISEITNTPALVITITPILTSIATSEAVDFSLLPALSKAILTTEYVRANYFPEISGTIFFQEPSPIEKDTTSELDNACSLDCAKRTWQTNNSSTLSIALVRVLNLDVAKNNIQEAASAFSQQNKSVYHFTDESFQKINSRLGLPDHTYIATAITTTSSTTSIKYFLVTNRESIVIIITDELLFSSNVTDRDDFSHVVSLQSLAELQNKKLQALGYP